jgi:hypothetical protein
MFYPDRRHAAGGQPIGQLQVAAGIAHRNDRSLGLEYLFYFPRL